MKLHQHIRPLQLPFRSTESPWWSWGLSGWLWILDLFNAKALASVTGDLTGQESEPALLPDA